MKKENIYPDNLSKYNLNHENQIIISMIPNGEKWEYLAVKNLFTLLRAIKIIANFTFWIIFISLKWKTNMNHIKKVCGNKDYCKVVTLPKKHADIRV